MKTLEEIETTIVEHLLCMDRQSGDEGDMCLYYDASTNRRCAIGCLLDPTIDTTEFEGSSTAQLYIEDSAWTAYSPNNKKLAAALRRSGIPADTQVQKALIKWQTRHDDDRNWNEDSYIGPID